MKKMKALAVLVMAMFMAFAAASCDVVGGLLGSGNSSEASSSETSSSLEESSSSVEVDEDEWSAYETITIAEALELCGDTGNVTRDRYYIRGTVDSITNAQYGAMIVSDETGTISVYNSQNADGTIEYPYMEEKPYKGDEVLLYCVLQNFKGTKEVQSAWIIDFRKAEVDTGDYTEMTIAEAREAAEGDCVKVDGVVARITYAFGQVPSGVYLVDETQSIYVYDGDLAARVKIGNKVTVLASKTYWVLDSEQSNAAKFGYKGCCQLENATLVSNDEGNNAFDKTWIPESTVKEMLETPVSEDVTTTIYKVNALVKKVVGTGFTNYYFFDIDGKTGAYTYTQCNGNDFTWLDAFDNKICTVYLSMINAKSTASECFFRLLPIEVIDENFVFDTANAAKYAVEYVGKPQFIDTYTGDPALEMETMVSSELLGFEGATLSYQSSNADVVYFEATTTGTIMHCDKDGEAVITITGAYGEVSYNDTVTVKVEKAEQIQALTVADAIVAEVGTKVTVRGIAGPSLINQTGFYLFGEDGSLIAVRVDASAFEGLAIGNEIVIEGTRYLHTKGGSNYFGQSCIDGAIIVANYYGAHEYSTAKFVTDKTAADFYALNPLVDYSTTAYVFKGVYTVVDKTFYKEVKLVDGTTSVTLYCSGDGQYKWLEPYLGQELVFEVAACNWSGKGYWGGCVLAVRTEGGKVLNQSNYIAK